MDELHDGGGVVRRTTDYQFGLHGSGIGLVPAADESLDMTQEVIFLEPGEEKAQNIVKAMSHQNAGEVVQLLSTEGPLRLSDIAERLDISLNAAKYHIENLMTAGILEISNTRYSVKGKKVKIYRLKNQVFIVAPRMNSIAEVRSALMKYSAALALFVGVFFIALVQPFFTMPAVPLQLSGSIRPGSTVPAAVLTDNSIIPALIIAAAVTLLVLIGYELHTLWKNRNYTA
ncbi:MAG: helix-turn-helix domain-containing protein [Methanoregula sp.]|nr:helix-turn-helix domain-containing protein [Methanoregula sp.]